MPSNKGVDKKIENHLMSKRDELIWSLSAQQDYRPSQIAKIFNFEHISTVMRIIERKPQRWQSPWVRRGTVEVDESSKVVLSKV